MFISRNEKEQINDNIKDIVKSLSNLNTALTYLSAKVKVLENAKPEAKPKKPRKKWTMSAEGRAKVSAAVKARHELKKLEKQNATSVSTTSI
jgi:hypothetical protein